MIILSRKLTLMGAGGELDVPIRIHLPIDKQGHWECEYEIGWPEASKRSKAGGIDSVQALMSAMQRIGSELYASDAHHSGNLRWERPGGGYGFPLHSAVQDLYEGDDRRM
jgi:hypothetical protein